LFSLVCDVCDYDADPRKPAFSSPNLLCILTVALSVAVRTLHKMPSYILNTEQLLAKRSRLGPDVMTVKIFITAAMQPAGPMLLS